MPYCDTCGSSTEDLLVLQMDRSALINLKLHVGSSPTPEQRDIIRQRTREVHNLKAAVARRALCVMNHFTERGF